MKKFLALLLALTMVLSLGMAAFAAPADLSGHTYTAYQIFKGTQAAGSVELGNVDWGTGVDGDALLAALKADKAFGNAFAACENAAAVAAVMTGDDWTDGSANAKEFAKLAFDAKKGDGKAVKQGDVLDAGYYLVVDTTPAGEAQYNLALLQLTNKGEFDINTKVDVPEVDKQVSDASQLNCEKEHTHDKNCYNWTDSNAAAIGDTVNFKVTAFVPEVAADYDFYYFIINDTMSKGLTFTEGSISVVDAAGNAVDFTAKDAVVNADGTTTIQVALQNAKAYHGQTVYMYYDAVLNEHAIVGVEGNLNKVDVKYSNNPNYKYDGTEDKDYPGFPDEKSDVPTGETPDAKTLTFTTGIKLFKIDGETKAALQGAEFTLEGNGVNTVLVSEEIFTVAADGEYYKLANGTYTKTDPVLKDSMEPAAEGATAGYVKAADDYAKADKIVVDGVAYRPYVPATDAGMDIFVLVKNNVAAYDSVDTKYTKETVLTTKDTEGAKKIVASVGEDGTVVFEGLDAGTYILTETQVPDGYNPIEPITVVISADLPEKVTTGNETCTWTITADGVELSFINEGTAVVAKLVVENNKGGTLPETGGIGTTIFYVVGAVLVLAAGILLITKKRMSAEG